MEMYIFFQVFKEAHEKQTEVLLKELKTDEKTATPTNDKELQREELQVTAGFSFVHS